MRLPHSAAPYVVGALHLAGWGVLLLAITESARGSVSGHGDGAFGLGLGLGGVAYALGMRHAFDADHIAAIDGTTRHLLGNGRPVRAVGTWFSLGHSTIVFVLCVLLVCGVKISGFADPDSALRRFTGTIGPIVSGVFLLAIATATGVGLWRRRRGSGALRDHHAGGPVALLMRRIGVSVERPSRMFVVGLLFGLGFDTATEIGLLVLAGSAASGAAMWWAVLALPILFAAGMSLLDSVQGAMARRAYSWRDSAGPANAHYDVIVTGATAGAALVIGATELTITIGDWRPNPVSAALRSVDLNSLGLLLTGILLATWCGAAILLHRRAA